MVDLFHGTGLSRLPGIARDGIRPSLGAANQWNTGWASAVGLVYLTDRWAAFYAGNPRAGLPGEPDGAAIIRVVIDERTTELFPDEDYLKYLLEHPESDAVRAAADSIGDIRHASINPRETRWKELDLTWERSFAEYGSIAIPCVEPSWIVGYHAIRSWEEFGIFAAANYLYRPFPIKICPYAEAFKSQLEQRAYAPLPMDVVHDDTESAPPKP